jgi:hypothetical protein
MMEHQCAHAGLRIHHEALGELYTDLVRLEQLPDTCASQICCFFHIYRAQYYIWREEFERSAPVFLIYTESELPAKSST